MSIPTPSFAYTLGDPPEPRDEPAASAALHTLRQEIDSIDQRLLETLWQRLDCCARIGVHKREHGLPMMQPHRIGLVQRRAEEFAAARGIDREFLRELYSLIIDETCRIELEVMKSLPGECMSSCP